MRTFNFIHLDKDLYSPCGTMQSAGYSYSWLKNNLCGLEKLQAEEQNISPYEIINKKIEDSQPGAKNLLFLPYLLGERSPDWNPDAKGAFIGLNMTHTNSDIYRSVLEGVAFNLRIILDIFNDFTPIDKVIMIGGGAKGKIWLQIISDIWQRKLLVPKYLEEATSMGAAICGGVGIGAFEDFKVIKKFNCIVDEITPRHEYKERYDSLYNVFADAYKALVSVYNSLSKIQ
jgi:xylulokinase